MVSTICYLGDLAFPDLPDIRAVSVYMKLELAWSGPDLLPFGFDSVNLTHAMLAYSIRYGCTSRSMAGLLLSYSVKYVFKSIPLYNKLSMADEWHLKMLVSGEKAGYAIWRHGLRRLPP